MSYALLPMTRCFLHALVQVVKGSIESHWPVAPATTRATASMAMACAEVSCSF